jgi:hypothetical protein
MRGIGRRPTIDAMIGATGAAPPSSTVRPARVAGVDMARGLAVVGMIVVHVAAAAAMSPGPGGVVLDVFTGRSAVLFAVLAGVSLALLSRGTSGGVRRRIAMRAALLFVLGVGLAEISTGPMIILSYYAVMFVLALPFLRVRPAALLAWSVGWAVVGPLVSFWLRSTVVHGNTLGGAVMASDLTSWSAAGAAGLRLLLDGAYPVLTWMPFVLAGLAVGRLDLRAAAVRVRLLVAGLAAVALGHGGSWFALEVLGGARPLHAVADAMAPRLGVPPDIAWELMTGSGLGATGTLTPAFLLLDAPHTGTPFEIVGSGGVAVVVLAACLVLAQRWPRAVFPLVATGTLSLTVYAAHVGAMALLTVAVPGWQTDPWPSTIGFVVVTLVLATGWRLLAGRGPLERVVHALSSRAGATA